MAKYLDSTEIGAVIMVFQKYGIIVSNSEVKQPQKQNND